MSYNVNRLKPSVDTHRDYKYITVIGTASPCLVNGMIEDFSHVYFRRTTEDYIPDDVDVSYRNSVKASVRNRRNKRFHSRMASGKRYRTKYNYQRMESANSLVFPIFVGDNWFNHNRLQKIKQIHSGAISALNCQKNLGVIDPDFQIGFTLETMYIPDRKETSECVVVWRMDGTNKEVAVKLY